MQHQVDCGRVFDGDEDEYKREKGMVMLESGELRLTCLRRPPWPSQGHVTRSNPRT
jgi:hypothetical protein